MWWRQAVTEGYDIAWHMVAEDSRSKDEARGLLELSLKSWLLKLREFCNLIVKHSHYLKLN